MHVHSKNYVSLSGCYIDYQGYRHKKPSQGSVMCYISPVTTIPKNGFS